MTGEEKSGAPRGEEIAACQAGIEVRKTEKTAPSFHRNRRFNPQAGAGCEIFTLDAKSGIPDSQRPPRLNTSI